MAAIGKLTAEQVTTLPVGLHGDGANLYRAVRPGGSRQRVMRYRFGGRQRELGLGSAGPHALTLAAARSAAENIRVQRRQGLDPLAEREAEAKTVRNTERMLARTRVFLQQRQIGGDQRPSSSQISDGSLAC